MGLSPSSLEKEIEKKYVELFFQQFGMPHFEAKQAASDMIEAAKKAIKENREDQMNSYIAEKILVDPLFRALLEKKRKEGVKDQDIRKWYSLHPLERRTMLEFDNITRTADFIKERNKGKTEEQAAKIVRKCHPIFGDSDDTTDTAGDDRPLPFELKDRINLYNTKRCQDNPEQFKKEISKSSTYNAWVREEIKKGNI